MSTLLLRLAAPMMAWDESSKFERRMTRRAPTKSAIIGLVASALGRTRDQDLSDLRALRFGVRVDRVGELLRDFHVAKGEKDYVTHRYYLSDAVFLAGLEGDDALLLQIESALRAPAFPPYLGRRSCPPEGRVSLGIRTGMALVDALCAEPWLGGASGRHDSARLSIEVDAGEQDAGVMLLSDDPVSFNQCKRQYGFRRVRHYDLPASVSADIQAQSIPMVKTEHDPMRELEG